MQIIAKNKIVNYGLNMDGIGLSTTVLKPPFCNLVVTILFFVFLFVFLEPKVSQLLIVSFSWLDWFASVIHVN